MSDLESQGQKLEDVRLDDPPSGWVRTADLLAALSLAADLSVGLPAEHAVRSCYIGMHIADRLGISAEQRATLFYAELLMDAGCTAWSSQFAQAIMGDEIPARRDFFYFIDAGKPLDVLGWLQQYLASGAPAHVRARRLLDFALHGKEQVREALRNTAEVAGCFALRLGMAKAVQATLWSVFEQWDGSGPNGTSGEQVLVTSRIVYATNLLEAFHSAGGRAAAIELAEGRRGKSFDPVVVDAFLSLAQEAAFWDDLELDSVWATVLLMEPQTPYRFLPQDKLEDVGLAFADFADLKSFYTVGHSRRVGDCAEAIARRMSLPEDEVANVRLAALMHDVGIAAVPSFVLHKPRERLTPVEWEALRLHPYHGERILSRVPVLAPVVPLVAAHHERVDGHGYYRGLSGSEIPLGARIIAVADRFDDLVNKTPEHAAREPEEALVLMRSEVPSGLFGHAVDALSESVPADQPATRGRGRVGPDDRPAGLTAREVEILRLLTTGQSRREMAARLYLSEHTVRHHLEHIYTKIDVSTRVAATLFAVEHNLL